MEMENEIVEIKEFRVENLNPYKKYIDVSVSYVSKEDGKIIKRFEFSDTPVRFTEALLEEIRRVTKSFEIEKQQDMKDKIANIMIRLSREINNFSKIREHEQFMKAFNRINCYKAILSDA